MDTGHASSLRKPSRGKTMLGKGAETEKSMESGEFTFKFNKRKSKSKHWGLGKISWSCWRRQEKGACRWRPETEVSGPSLLIKDPFPRCARNNMDPRVRRRNFSLNRNFQFKIHFWCFLELKNEIWSNRMKGASKSPLPVLSGNFIENSYEHFDIAYFCKLDVLSIKKYCVRKKCFIHDSGAWILP